MGYGLKLFSPIYENQTLDAFAPPQTAREESCGSSEWVLQLFSYSHPLWEAHLAVQEESPNEFVESLALPSYRTQLNITDSPMGDEMVSSCFRLIAYINKRQDVMMTLHPSEPILAFVAASRTSDPSTRIDVLQCPLSNSQEGKLSTSGVGKTVSPLLLLFAFDEKQFAEPRARPCPILLAGFIETLFGRQLRLPDGWRPNR